MVYANILQRCKRQRSKVYPPINEDSSSLWILAAGLVTVVSGHWQDLSSGRHISAINPVDVICTAVGAQLP